MRSVAADRAPATGAESRSDSAWRDPEPTRERAMQALASLRSCEVPSSSWSSTPELQRYVEAVLDHGDVLRTNTWSAVQGSWESSGVSDSHLTALLERQDALNKEISRKTCDSTRILEKSEKIQRDHSGWESDPELRREVSELHAARKETWDSISVLLSEERQISSQLVEANGTRQRILSDEARKTLAQEREMGGKVSLSQRTRLSKKDSEMMEECLSLFPTDMIAYAEAQRRSGLRVMRSKKRAHYVFQKSAKVKVVHAKVLSASAAASGNPVWHQDFLFARNPEKAMHDGLVDLDDMTVPDTADNREKLRLAVAEYNEYLLPSGSPARKRARVQEVAHPTSGEPRLSLLIDEAYHEYAWDSSEGSGELSFDDEQSMTHEFGHHMEAKNPEVSAACRAFLQRRTKNLPRERYGPGKGKSAEWVTADGFVNRYIGKHYEDEHHTEVFSMGVEALAGGHGGLLGIDVHHAKPGQGLLPKHISDPEHFNLVMGLLAVANKAL